MDSILRNRMKAELVAAATAIATKYGVVATVKPGSYSLNSFTAPVEFAEVEAKQAQTQMGCLVHGIPDTVLGTTFKHKTKTFTVTEVKAAAPLTASFSRTRTDASSSAPSSNSARWYLSKYPPTPGGYPGRGGLTYAD